VAAKQLQKEVLGGREQDVNARLLHEAIEQSSIERGGSHGNSPEIGRAFRDRCVLR